MLKSAIVSIFAQLTWWCSSGLLAILLLCAFRGRFVSKYPVFCAYAFVMLLGGICRYYVFKFYPDEYLRFYWYTEFLTVAGGYAIIWQMYSHTLQPYPGSARMARVVVSAVFAAIWVQLLFIVVLSQGREVWGRVLLMERNLYSVQVVLILLFLLLIWYYRIPLGGNLNGLLAGYGLYVAATLITLTLRSALGAPFQVWWDILSQISVVVSLGIWAIAFRSYCPNPVPEHKIELERDYELAAQRTVEAIGRARGYLARAFLQ